MKVLLRFHHRTGPKFHDEKLDIDFIPRIGEHVFYNLQSIDIRYSRFHKVKNVITNFSKFRDLQQSRIVIDLIESDDKIEDIE